MWFKCYKQWFLIINFDFYVLLWNVCLISNFENFLNPQSIKYSFPLPFYDVYFDKEIETRGTCIWTRVTSLVLLLRRNKPWINQLLSDKSKQLKRGRFWTYILLHWFIYIFSIILSINSLLCGFKILSDIYLNNVKLPNADSSYSISLECILLADP